MKLYTNVNDFKNELIKESKKLNSNHIDIKKLESIANSIAVLCNNEYGDVFFNDPPPKKTPERIERIS